MGAAEIHDSLSLEKKQQLVEVCPTKVFKLDDSEKVTSWRPDLSLSE